MNEFLGLLEVGNVHAKNIKGYSLKIKRKKKYLFALNAM